MKSRWAVVILTHRRKTEVKNGVGSWPSNQGSKYATLGLEIGIAAHFPEFLIAMSLLVGFFTDTPAGNLSTISLGLYLPFPE